MIKKIFTMLIALLLVTLTTVNANGDKTAEQRAEENTQILKEELGLSSEQEQQVKQILLKKEKQMDYVYSEYANDSEKLIEASKHFSEDTSESLKTVLTEEQIQILKNKSFKF
jgi:uncharacterized protein YpuA (DUF1002 family)